MQSNPKRDNLRWGNGSRLDGDPRLRDPIAQHGFYFFCRIFE